MTQFVVSITVDEVIDALGDFIQPFAAASEIIRAQVNRVPMPPDPCIVLTELLEVDLETPIKGERLSGLQADIIGKTRVDVQIDFYGPAAGDQCKAVKNVFRSEYAPAQFPDGIKPRYCSDGIQSPLITGEQQWESRWTLTASLQYNPIVSLPQQSANALAVTSSKELP
jgi:hypothetical protein